VLVHTAERLLALCADTLGVAPASDDFATEFRQVVLALAGQPAA
jgi:hypothetical protein